MDRPSIYPKKLGLTIPELCWKGSSLFKVDIEFGETETPQQVSITQWKKDNGMQEKMSFMYDFQRGELDSIEPNFASLADHAAMSGLSVSGLDCSTEEFERLRRDVFEKGTVGSKARFRLKRNISLNESADKEHVALWEQAWHKWKDALVVLFRRDALSAPGNGVTDEYVRLYKEWESGGKTPADEPKIKSFADICAMPVFKQIVSTVIKFITQPGGRSAPCDFMVTGPYGQELFDKIRAKVPTFKQALFYFEAKDGAFGPVSYCESSLRQDAAEESGGWCVSKSTGAYEFMEDYDAALENGYDEALETEVGEAVAEILNESSGYLVALLYGGNKAFFSGENALSNGVLAVSLVPQQEALDLGEDDDGCYLSLRKDFKGLNARFTLVEQISNAVEVP